MLSYHSALRKTVRWYKKVGVHMVEMFLMNAFYMYVKFAPDPQYKVIVEKLIGPHSRTR